MDHAPPRRVRSSRLAAVQRDTIGPSASMQADTSPMPPTTPSRQTPTAPARAGVRVVARAGALACALLVTGCASTGEEGYAPRSLADAYTEVQTQISMITMPDGERGCAEFDCLARMDFDRRVARLGAQLDAAAQLEFPTLAARVPSFTFNVVEKTEPGTASTAGGRVLVLRPVSALALHDEALAFLLAREMGHVIAEHHDENVTTGILISLIAQVFLPVANLPRLFGALMAGGAGASAGTGIASAAANASMTAASFASTRVLVRSYKPRQRTEADDIALRLLARTGVNHAAVLAAFAADGMAGPPTDWMEELRASVERLAPQADAAAVAPLAATGGQVAGAAHTGPARADP